MSGDFLFSLKLVHMKILCKSLINSFFFVTHMKNGLIFFQKNKLDLWQVKRGCDIIKFVSVTITVIEEKEALNLSVI